MWPVPRGRMRRIASCVPWMTACRLISSWRVTLASLLLVERRDRHDPGVVDEDVERAEALLDLVEERGEAGAVGDVEGEADASRRRARPRRPRPRAGVEVADRDDDPLARERTGERLTDAAGAARDDGDLAAQRAGSLGHGVNYGVRLGHVRWQLVSSDSQEGAARQIGPERRRRRRSRNITPASAAARSPASRQDRHRPLLRAR